MRFRFDRARLAAAALLGLALVAPVAAQAAEVVLYSSNNVDAIKVVTERGVVFLMGRVTDAEAKRAVDLTRNVGGVQKVVRVFEILTQAEVAAIQHSVPAQAPAAASAPAPAPAPAKP